MKRRKSKYTYEVVNTLSILRENQHTGTMEQSAQCPHCRAPNRRDVNTSSKLCGTKECLFCKERMFTFLDSEDVETSRCLYKLNFFKSVSKVNDALRWFNIESNFRPKQ